MEVDDAADEVMNMAESGIGDSSAQTQSNMVCSHVPPPFLQRHCRKIMASGLLPTPVILQDQGCAAEIRHASSGEQAEEAARNRGAEFNRGSDAGWSD